MFERYTEAARRALFFARYEASQLGSISIEPEHLLLGLLREANHLTLAECRDRLAERTGVRVHPWTVGRALRRCGWT